MYDCVSGKLGQPIVQQYSLNTPDQCSNSSTVYLPPLPNKSIQVLQIPNYTPIVIHNCLIQIKTLVGYCGNSGFTHMAHVMRTLDEKVLSPSSLECLHAVKKGEMQFTLPPLDLQKPPGSQCPLFKDTQILRSTS